MQSQFPLQNYMGHLADAATCNSACRHAAGQLPSAAGSAARLPARRRASRSRPGYNPVQKRAPRQTMEDLLMDLIKGTIAPHTWKEMGGPGTIQYYPLGMALVINQAQEVQEDVENLLKALRRLQDMEVAIEMRLVLVSESFYERIGVDFNVNLQTPVSPGDAEPACSTARSRRSASQPQFSLQQRDHRLDAGRHADARPGHPDQEQQLQLLRPALRRLHRPGRGRRAVARPGVPERDPGVHDPGSRPGRQPDQHHDGAEDHGLQWPGRVHQRVGDDSSSTPASPRSRS